MASEGSSIRLPRLSALYDGRHICGVVKHVSMLAAGEKNLLWRYEDEPIKLQLGFLRARRGKHWFDVIYTNGIVEPLWPTDEVVMQHRQLQPVLPPTKLGNYFNDLREEIEILGVMAGQSGVEWVTHVLLEYLNKHESRWVELPQH